MPRRLRQSKRRVRQLSFSERAALERGDPERMAEVFGSEAAAKRAWEEAGGTFSGSRHPGHRPAAFWAFARDVPEDLRVRPPAADPRILDLGGDRAREERRQGQARVDVDRRRLEWLADSGLLEEWELAALAARGVLES